MQSMDAYLLQALCILKCIFSCFGYSDSTHRLSLVSVPHTHENYAHEPNPNSEQACLLHAFGVLTECLRQLRIFFTRFQREIIGDHFLWHKIRPKLS